MGNGSRFLAAFALLAGSAGALAQLADPVVASRGTAEVTLSEIDARVGQLPVADRAGFMNSPERIEQLIQTMLMDEQLADEARERELQKRPLFDVEVELAKDQILSRRRQQQFLADLEVPDMETLAKERYLAAPDQYTIPERLQLMHVLVRAIGRTVEDAEALAGEVRAKALEGADFAALVAEYTDEKNPQTGNRTDGMLHNVRRGQMVSTFEEAAFALKEPGDISPVVKTPFGWHVIKLLERKPALRRSYEDVRGSIVAELRKDYIERTQKYHVDKLRSMPLEADPDLVLSLRTRYLQEGDDPQSVVAPDAGQAEERAKGFESGGSEDDARSGSDAGSD